MRNSSFGTELANLLQSNIIIRNPAYPDPYGGKDPLTFASTAPPNITIINDDIVNSFAQTANSGFLNSSRVIWRFRWMESTRGAGQPGVLQHQQPGSHDRAQGAASVGPHRAGQPDRRHEVSRVVRASRPAVRQPLAVPPVAYTLVKGDDNLTSINYFNRAADWGPSNTDRRQTLVVSGSVIVPWSLMVGGVWTLRSAMPFSAVAATDLNDDGSITDLVPGTTRNSGNRDLNLVAVNAYRAANGRAPIAIDQIDSNRYNSLDVAATRTFNLSGSKKVDIDRSGLQLMGTTNLLASGGVGSYVTNALSDSFGKVLQAGNGNRRSLLCASHGNGDGAGVIDHWMSSAKGGRDVQSSSVGWLMRARWRLLRPASRLGDAICVERAPGRSKQAPGSAIVHAVPPQREIHGRAPYARRLGGRGKCHGRYGTPLNKEEAAQVTDYLATVFPGKPKPPGVVVPGPVRALIQEWPVATPGARPHDPAVAPDGTVWYTGQANGSLGGSIPLRAKQRNSPSRNCHRPRPSYHMVWGRTD